MDLSLFIQAAASLLIVIGLIYLTGWVLRKVSFKQGISATPFSRNKTEKKMQLVETLWLDARYRIVHITVNNTPHTILLGPQQALQITDPNTLAELKTHAAPSHLLAS